MNKKRFSTLILMPYLPIKTYFKISNLLVWSYKNKKDDFISDVNLKNHIDKLVACYKLHTGRPIDNPAIISTTKLDFANPTIKTIRKIEAIKNILLLTCILENNPWSFMTSDNFEVFYQRFNVGDEGIATKAGAIHSITTGGYNVNQISFVKPEHVNLSTLTSLRVNKSVLDALEDAMNGAKVDTVKSQIIQSLNPFFNAYRNSNETSWASRILLMIMSFELLFGASSRESFKKNILKYSLFGSPYNPLPVHSYPIINTQTGAIIKYSSLTYNEIWAEEFYKLRHRIIHGDTIYDSDFIFNDLLNLTLKQNPHFYIAVNFFVVCLLNKLRENGRSVPHWIVYPHSNTRLFAKNLSGIQDEIFKIEDVDMYDTLRKS